MGERKPSEVARFLKDQFQDLSRLMEADGVSQRALDSMLDIFLRQFLRLMEQFVGEDAPTTPRERRRRRILEAAIELFLRRGYTRTTLDDIAAEASVAKGTIYQHFKSKADVLAHAGALEKQRYMKAMREVLTADVSDNERLRRSLQVYLMSVHTLPLSSRILAGDREMAGVLEEMGFPDPQAATDLQALGLRFQMRRAAPGRWSADDLERRSKVLIGLIQASSFVGEARFRSGLSVEEYAGVLADMLMEGIGALEERR